MTITLFAAALLTVSAVAQAEVAEPGPVVTARDLATLRDIEAMSVSPDGEWVAFQIRQPDPDANRYDTAWHVVSSRGGEARRLAEAGEPLLPAQFGRINGTILPVAPVWSPDGKWIAYLKKEKGRVQVWRSRRDGRESEQLTHNLADARVALPEKTQVTVTAYSGDGKKLFFETEPSQPQVAAALHRQGLSGHLYDERFFPSYSPLPVQPSDIDFLSSRAGGKVSTESEDRARQLWVYVFAKRQERRATKEERQEFEAVTRAPKIEGREAVRGPIVGSPGGALAWLEARDPELQGGYAPLTLVVQPNAATGPILCQAAECTGQMIEALWWRREHEVIYLRREGPVFHEYALYGWKPGDITPRLILRTTDRFTSFAWKCAMGADRLMCLYEEPAQPRRLVAIDLDTGAVETLYDPNAGFARFDLGAKPARLLFRSPSGIENYGYLVLPPDHKAGTRLSLVVVTYRCHGFLRGGTGDEYPIFAFAAAGHAVLCFNAPDMDWDRAARESHGTQADYNRGPGDPGRRRVQEGLEAAVAHLDRMGLIDPSRVGVTGLSAGSELVSYALFNTPNLVAGIASGAEMGPASAFLYGPAGQQLLGRWGLDSPTSARWDALSLARNANKVHAAALLNIADHEMASSLDAFAALRRESRAVEMYVFPDEYHIKWQPAHRLAIYNRNIDWMNFWLRGVEDPAPAKAEQYKRWRAMRVQQCELFKRDDAPWYCRE